MAGARRLSNTPGVPGAAGEMGLPQTPTWAVALVLTVMFLVAVAVERGLHKLGHWFQERQKKALAEAVEMIKTELMLLGVVTLLLQTPIGCPPSRFFLMYASARVILRLLSQSQSQRRRATQAATVDIDIADA